MRLRQLLAAASVLVLLSAPVFAQAPPNPASARVRYNSLKNTAKPDGDLKAQIDAIDKEIGRSHPARADLRRCAG